MKYWPLLILLIITFFLRLPSLSEPYWYGDEGVTLTASQAINRGEILYGDIDDNKPPLLYFLGAAAGGDQKTFKTLTLVWSLFTVTVFYFLTTKFFKQNLAFLVSLFFSFLANTPILEGNIINGEIYFILPTILSAYLVWKSHVIARSITTKQSQRKNLEIATPFGLAMTYSVGFIFSLGFLIKVPALMDFLAIILFLIFISPQIFSLKTFKQLIIIALGFLTPLLLTTCYFSLNNAFFEFLNSAFLNNFTYSFAWQTKWLTPDQYLFLKIFFLMLTLLFLLVRRKKLSLQIIFLTLWFAFSLFGSLLSSRPYPHYLIQVLPSFSLLSIYLLTKKRLFCFFVFLFFCFLILWYQFGGFDKISHQTSFNYYKNYFLYKTGQLNSKQYFQSFDRQVLLTYSLAQFLQISSDPEEKTFVWSDNSLIYALSKRTPIGRYITAYYIESIPSGKKETIDNLKTYKPKFVIITLPKKNFPELDKMIKDWYLLRKKFNGALIYQKK